MHKKVSKKLFTLIVVLALAMTCAGIVLAMTISDYVAEKKHNEVLKQKNEKAEIVELFHDQGHIYMTPDEPKEGETVTLRLRTARYNVTRAQIQYTIDEGANWKTVDMEFEKQDETGYFDIWKGEISAEGELIYYRFTVSNSVVANTVYYDISGISLFEGEYKHGWQIVPGHDIAEWAKGALWYSVAPDAFYNGNTINDKQSSGATSHVTWNQLHKGLYDRYGGDLDGIKSKLDYINSLGTDAIFMNPVFKSYQNMGYGSSHYDEVESSYGNYQDLVELADAVHERDMHMITDVVLTFTDTNSYYFNQEGRWPVVGATQSKDSEWYEMYDIYNWPDHYLTTWDSPALDLNSDRAKELVYANKDSYLRRYAEIFDGYRFDCGGWLWGKTETEEVPASDIIREIKKELRSVDDDFLLMAEADGNNLNKNLWDSHFNINYTPKLQDYAKGLINETLMTEAMYEFAMEFPRNVALSVYNPLCFHDTYRVLQDDDYMYNAAVLLQMTYLGSPCIYYGEEVNFVREAAEGVGSVTSFYGMDWDESNWDYQRLNFYKAIGELRKEYSCLKTGVFKMLGYNNETNTITYGRWDQAGAAITVTSQNEDTIEVEVSVRECDIVDGTILTDWYTGKQYKVKDGKINAEVIPGGTVFVTGEKSSTYLQDYAVTEIGNVRANDIIANGANSFEMKGKGTIAKSKDSMSFINVAAHETFSVYANLRGDGESAFLIRNSLDDDDSYYGVVVNGDELSVVTRTKKGEKAKTLTTINSTKNTYVKLERSEDNTFRTYITEVSNGNLGEWKLVNKSDKTISMNNQVYYGFAPIKKEMQINNITFKQHEKQSNFDKFDEEISSVLFDNINADFVSIVDGNLVITNSKKEKLHYLVTSPMEDDWTFKTKMSFKPTNDEFAGVLCKQDDNNFVVAGQGNLDGKEILFIGKVVNGELVIYDSVEDKTQGSSLVIQLQRVGAYYSAVYSTDECASWNYIGKLYANFANELVGVIVSGESESYFDWVSFGDSINDGKSVNTPQTPIDVDTTYQDNDVLEECKYEFLTGDWSVVNEGWHQGNVSVFAQAAATNKVFKGLSSEMTIEIEDGSGWAGLAFGKNSPNSNAEDGFVLKYYKNGNLRLTKNQDLIAECKLNASKKDAMRVTLEASEGRIVVYAGQDATPVINIKDTGYSRGYVSFCTDGASANFSNFHHGSTSATWAWTSGIGVAQGKSFTLYHQLVDGRQIHSIATLVGHSFTNFVATAKIHMTPVDKENLASAGLLLCASEGKSAMEDGIHVYLDDKGRIVLAEKGIEQANYTIAENVQYADIMVVKQKGQYQVYIKGVKQPIIEYSEEYERGGVLSLYTNNSRSSFANVDIQNMQPGEVYTDTALATRWLNGDNDTYIEKFSSELVADNYYEYGDTAEFEIVDEMLKCTEVTGFESGITLTNNMYEDFTMEFKLRFNASSSGWMSVGMRKGLMDGNHALTGLSFMISPSGRAFFYSSVQQKEIASGTIPKFTDGTWYNVKIVAKGSSVIAYINGQQVVNCKDMNYVAGFVSFTSGMETFLVDDLKITPLR